MDDDKKPQKRYVTVGQRSRGTSVYLGAGSLAEYAAALYAEENAQLNRENDFRRDWKRLEATFRAFEQAFRPIWEAAFLLRGYYRHKRGAWRKRQAKQEAFGSPPCDFDGWLWKELVQASHQGKQGWQEALTKRWQGLSSIRTTVDSRWVVSVGCLTSIAGAGYLEPYASLRRAFAQGGDWQSLGAKDWIYALLSARREYAQATVLFLADRMERSEEHSWWFERSLLRRAKVWLAAEWRYRADVSAYEQRVLKKFRRRRAKGSTTRAASGDGD